MTEKVNYEMCRQIVSGCDRRFQKVMDLISSKGPFNGMEKTEN